VSYSTVLPGENSTSVLSASTQTPAFIANYVNIPLVDYSVDYDEFGDNQVVQNRFYPGLKLQQATERLQQFFYSQGHEVQTLKGGEITILQARKETTITNLTGLSSALTVRFVPENSGVRVEIGVSKWIEKAAVGIVGLAVFWPLIVTSAIGAYNQQKLTLDVWRLLDDVAGVTSTSDTGGGGWSSWVPGYKPGSWSEDITCASCGAVLPAGVGFCAKCGANLKKTNNCSACGVKNQQGSRFCNGCGAKLESD